MILKYHFTLISSYLYIDYPSTPERPTIVTVGPDSVDLSWKIPESNGGTPIVEYKIEYMVRLH